MSDTNNLQLLRLPQVMAVSAMSRSSIYNEVREGRLAAPLRFSHRFAAWKKSDVDQWLAARIAMAEKSC